MHQLKNDPAGDLFNALDGGLIVVDGDRRVTAWNAWLASAAGIPVEDALGQRLDALFPNANLRRLDGAIREALASGVASLLTHSLHPALFALRTRAGRELVHDISVRPIGEKPPAIA